MLKKIRFVVITNQIKQNNFVVSSNSSKLTHVLIIYLTRRKKSLKPSSHKLSYCFN